LRCTSGWYPATPEREVKGLWFHMLARASQATWCHADAA
jgi:hypothetical protein